MPFEPNPEPDERGPFIATRPGAGLRGPTLAVPGSRAAQADPRWPRIAAALAALRARRRHAVRIVDADCGCGTPLIEAARHARMLGFTAIEALGVDGSPSMIGRARAAASRLRDPAIGLDFALADMAVALRREADCPADIVLWHGTLAEDQQPGIADALAAAGDLVIGDAAAPAIPRRAA